MALPAGQWEARAALGGKLSLQLSLFGTILADNLEHTDAIRQRLADGLDGPWRQRFTDERRAN